MEQKDHKLCIAPFVFAEEVRYFLQSDWFKDSFSLTLTDGVHAYSATLDEKHIRKELQPKGMHFDEYMRVVRCALMSQDKGRNFKYELRRIADGSVTLQWLFNLMSPRVMDAKVADSQTGADTLGMATPASLGADIGGGGTSLLGGGSFESPEDTINFSSAADQAWGKGSAVLSKMGAQVGVACVRRMLGTLCDRNATLLSEELRLRREHERMCAQRDEVFDQLAVLVREKSKLEEEMLAKFVLVLNEKKEEIRALVRQRDELEDKVRELMDGDFEGRGEENGYGEEEKKKKSGLVAISSAGARSGSKRKRSAVDESSDADNNDADAVKKKKKAKRSSSVSASVLADVSVPVNAATTKRDGKAAPSTATSAKLPTSKASTARREQRKRSSVDVSEATLKRGATLSDDKTRSQRTVDRSEATMTQRQQAPPEMSAADVLGTADDQLRVNKEVQLNTLADETLASAAAPTATATTRSLRASTARRYARNVTQAASEPTSADLLRSFDMSN